MEQTSNAERNIAEEKTPTGGIFDDNQPMTYEEGQSMDPLEGDQQVITSYDDDDAGQSKEDLPDHVKAYRELQSKADKDAQALKRLQEEYEGQKALIDDYNTYKPIIRYLEENPQVIDRLAKAGQEPRQQEQPKQVREELSVPTKPRDYDEFAAYNDPDSESFKYRKANDAYMYKSMERMREEVKQEKQQFEEMIAQREREMRQRMAEQELHKVLARDYQMSEKERRDFMEFSNNPNPSLDALVNIFRASISKAGSEQTKTPKHEFKSIAGSAGSTNPDEALDDNQMFTKGLSTKRRNLFETV